MSDDDDDNMGVVCLILSAIALPVGLCTFLSIARIKNQDFINAAYEFGTRITTMRLQELDRLTTTDSPPSILGEWDGQLSRFIFLTKPARMDDSVRVTGSERCFQTLAVPVSPHTPDPWTNAHNQPWNLWCKRPHEGYSQVTTTIGASTLTR